MQEKQEVEEEETTQVRSKKTSDWAAIQKLGLWDSVVGAGCNLKSFFPFKA